MLYVIEINDNADHPFQTLKEIKQTIEGLYPNVKINPPLMSNYSVAYISNDYLIKAIENYIDNSDLPYSSSDVSSNEMKYLIDNVRRTVDLQGLSDDYLYDLIDKAFEDMKRRDEEAAMDAQLDKYEAYMNQEYYGDDFVRNVS